jgi:putative transposase
VRRALNAVFAGPVGKDVVSRVWRKVKGDWDAWNARSLGEEPIVRLILDGTVARVRLDRKATSLSLACRARRARRRPEDSAGDQEHRR